MAESPRVRLQNRQRKLKVNSAGLRALVERVLEGQGADGAAVVEIVLLRDAPMAELNRRYRGRSGATDVLSFPTRADGWPPEEPPLLGSVVICVDRAQAQAAARGLAVAEEIGRLAVHGVLHLLGFRDETARERQRMRRQEDRYLRSPTERR